MKNCKVETVHNYILGEGLLLMDEMESFGMKDKLNDWNYVVMIYLDSFLWLLKNVKIMCFVF